MGTYSHYLQQRLNPGELNAARREQLLRIQKARGGRPILSLGASLLPSHSQSALSPDDIMSVEDLLEEMEGDELDLVLQVSGGPLELAEDLLHVLRSRFHKFTVLVPRQLRNPGTLLAVAAEKLIMRPLASLQPLLVVSPVEGRLLPADLVAAEDSGVCPVERRLARTSLDTVRGWLARAAQIGRDCPEEEAQILAVALTDTERWGLPGRSLRPAQIRDLGIPLEVTAGEGELAEALDHYDALLQLCLSTNLYKVFETPESQVFRAGGPPPNQGPPAPPPEPPSDMNQVAILDVQCECGTESRIQANLGQSSPLQDGHWAFPADNVFTCPECMRKKNLAEFRSQIETQARKKIVT